MTDIPAIAGDTRRKKMEISMQRRTSRTSARSNKISPETNGSPGTPSIDRLTTEDLDKRESAPAPAPALENDQRGVEEPLMEEHPDRGATAPEPQVEAPPTVLRQRRRYTYSLHQAEAKKLDPTFQAESAIQSGMTPKGMVAAEFNRVYSSGAVANLEMVCNQAHLKPLVTEYDAKVGFLLLQIF